jgi:hypothetical protein
VLRPGPQTNCRDARPARTGPGGVLFASWVTAAIIRRQVVAPFVIAGESRMFRTELSNLGSPPPVFLYVIIRFIGQSISAGSA